MWNIDQKTRTADQDLKQRNIAAKLKNIPIQVACMQIYARWMTDKHEINIEKKALRNTDMNGLPTARSLKTLESENKKK